MDFAPGGDAFTPFRGRQELWMKATALKEQSNNMRQKFLAVALALLATVGFTAYAQETTSGSIQGTVVDAQGATVPGATVTITSAQGAKTFVTDNNGRFFAPFISPGKVSVRVELTGFSPVEQKNVEVRLGSRLDMSFTLKVGDLAEVIEVVGTAPVVDTSSTTAGGILDSASLQRLPVGRAMTDTLYLVPGVSDSSGLGRQNPSIGGGSGLENNYVIDGVNITDTGFGAIGAYNSTYGSLGSGVTTDFVKETQVKTAGFEAEYGQATGGVVNVVTKSGGNEFSGSVFGYMQPDALESSWKKGTSPNGTVNTTGREAYDFGLSVGGPLVKDKVFFFGTFNPQFQTRSFEAPAGYPYASLGSVERKRKIYSYAGKLTMQASSNHRFDISAFGDPSTGESGLQNSAVLRRVYYAGNPGTADIEGGFSELEYGGHNQTLRYDGIINPNWLVEASVAHATNKFFETPQVDDYGYTDLTRVPNGRSGGLGFWENNDGSNTQFTLKSTHIFQAGGNHQFRYGGAYEDINFTRDVQYSGAPLRLADGQTTLTGGPIQIRTGGGVRFYRATRGKLLPSADTTPEVLQLLRPGHLADGQADLPARHSLGAPGAGRRRAASEPLQRGRVAPRPERREHPQGLLVHLGQPVGPAHRRDLRHHGQRQVQDLRRLGPLLRQDPQRPGGPRHVGRRRHHAPELPRRRADPARRQRHLVRRQHDPPADHRAARPRSSTPRPARPTRKRSSRASSSKWRTTSAWACATSTARCPRSSRTSASWPFTATSTGPAATRWSTTSSRTRTPAPPPWAARACRRSPSRTRPTSTTLSRSPSTRASRTTGA